MTTEQTFEIAVGDTGPSIVENLKNADGSPINLAGGSVRFRLYNSSGVLVIDRAAVIVDAPNGQVRFDWLAGDTAAGGTFFRRWVCTVASGQIISVPTEDNLDGYPVSIIDPATALISGRLVCEAWCAPVDVVRCPPCQAATFDPSVMLEAIDVTSDILFLLCGRQFPGVCSDTVRPNRPEWSSLGLLGSVSLAGEVWGSGEPRYRDYANDRNLGSGPISEIRLPGYPIIAISQVMVDGAIVPPSAYKIDDDRWLARVDGSAWPMYQKIGTDPTELGTFEVVYTYGVAIPPMARRAAAAYACQVLKSWSGDTSCSLPPRTQSVVRQGLSANQRDPNDYIDNGKTGVDEADRFLKAVNPNGLQERAAVLSPDVNWPAHRLR